MKSFFATLVVCLAVQVNAVELDPGGVSIDFSQGGPDALLQGPNLLADGSFDAPESAWDTDVHVHRTQPDGSPHPLEAELRKLVRFDRSKGVARLAMPRSAYGDPADETPLFSAYYSQMVEVPPRERNTVYVLTWRYRGELVSELPNALLNATLVCHNAERRKAAEPVMVNVTPAGRWKAGTLEILAPPSTRRIRVLLRLYGAGEVAFDEVSLRQRRIDEGVTVRGIPFAFTDNTYHLSQGDPGILVFALRNEPGMPIEAPRLKLWLPNGFDLLDVQRNLELLESTCDIGGTMHTIDLHSIRKVIKPETYTAWNSPALLIRSRYAAGDHPYTARYWYEDGDYRSEALSFALQVDPPIPAETPARFRSGVMFSREADYDEVEALAAAYARWGFNSAHVSPGAFSDALEARDVFRYYQPIWLCNGYRLGEAPKPDEARFQYADGSYHTEGRFEGICPVEIYRRGDYFREHIVQPLRQLIVEERATDSIMPNWEPYMFDYKGCFCPRCKEEFIAHTKLSRETVESDWPRDMLVKHREAWTAFRSWQHGRLVATLEETIAGLGVEAGVDAHFIPEIAWDALTPRGSNSEARNQIRPQDYLGDLPVIEPWGPYNFHRFLQPYEYNLGCHLSVFVAAEAQKAFLAETLDAPPRQTALIAFPHGFQGHDWITEPEALAFETLSFFVNGWEGSIAYRFPRGYDARWWSALAQVNTTVAQYEAFTLDGTRADHELERLTPLPDGPRFFRSELDSIRVLRILPEIQKMSLVQSVEWRLGERRLIAVGNAWERGETFVRVKLDDLGWFGRYVVWQPHASRHFASPSGDLSWSAGELRDGVLLQTGGLRYSFVVIEPVADHVDYGVAVGMDELQAAMAARRPQIEAALATDLAYLEDRRLAEIEAGSVPDLAKLTPVEGDPAMQVGTRPGMEHPGVIIRHGDQQLVIDPTNGARVASWTVDGHELVHQSPALGLAVDAIWWPRQAAAILNQVYQVADQAAADGELRLTFERRIGPESEGLEGCLLRKTVTVRDGLAGFEVQTTLIDETAQPVRFAFRFHNMHTPLELVDGQRGWGTLTGEARPIRFERDFIKRFYRAVPDADPELEKAFRLEQVLTIAEPQVTFGAPWLPCRTQATFGGDLYGVCFWDSGKQACSTFEPIWQRQELAPGAEWQAAMSFQALN